jgi:hypothetical protein
MTESLSGNRTTREAPRQQIVQLNAVVVAGIAAVLAALVGVLGVMLDWVTVASGFGEIGRKGIDTDDGKLALFVLLVGLLAALIAMASHGRGWFLIVGVLGAAATAIAVYDGEDVGRRVADVNASASGFVHASVGVGLWVLGIAGALMLVSSLWGYSAARKAG